MLLLLLLLEEDVVGGHVVLVMVVAHDIHAAVRRQQQLGGPVREAPLNPIHPLIRELQVRYRLVGDVFTRGADSRSGHANGVVADFRNIEHHGIHVDSMLQICQSIGRGRLHQIVIDIAFESLIHFAASLLLFRPGTRAALRPPRYHGFADGPEWSLSPEVIHNPFNRQLLPTASHCFVLYLIHHI